MKKLLSLLLVLPLFVGVTHAQSVADCQALDQEAQASAPRYSPPLAKVVKKSGRTPLYIAPTADCKGKQFIIQNNNVAVYQSQNGYDYAMYMNHRTGDVVYGWIKESHLVTTGTLAPEQ